MGTTLMKRSEYAKLAGVSPAAVTKAARTVLKPALVGRRIDISHLAAQEYASNHTEGIAIVGPENQNTGYQPGDEMLGPNGLMPIPEDVAEMMDWTLREILEQFRTETGFSDWLKDTNVITTIREKQIKIAQREGELISREMVFRMFIDPVNSMHLRMLTDLAKVLSVRIPAMHSAGKKPEELEEKIRKMFADYIRPMKAKMVKAMRNGHAR